MRTLTRDAAGPPPSTPPPDNRRDQLLDATMMVVAERGFPETRIADVAARAGTSPALVIYYFKTRDQLLTEAVRRASEVWFANASGRIAALASPTARLEELITICVTPAGGGERWVSNVLLDVWALSLRNSDIAEVRREFETRWRETVAEVVASGHSCGEFEQVDPIEFASTLTALLDGFAARGALEDPVVTAHRAFALCMRYAASQLRIDWDPRPLALATTPRPRTQLGTA